MAEVNNNLTCTRINGEEVEIDCNEVAVTRNTSYNMELRVDVIMKDGTTYLLRDPDRIVKRQIDEKRGVS